MAFRLFISIFSILIFSGCGPEQTARDAANEVADEYVQGKMQEYRQYEGTYEGYFTGVSGKRVDVRMTLIVFNLFFIDGNSNQVKEVPNFIGSLASCGSVGEDGKCKSDWLPVARINLGQLDEAGQIRIIGDNRTSGGDVVLILNIVKNGFEGTYYNNGGNQTKAPIHFSKAN